MIDLHSHILPNIDDGSRSLEESIEIIKQAVSNGVTDIIVTPKSFCRQPVGTWQKRRDSQ